MVAGGTLEGGVPPLRLPSEERSAPVDPAAGLADVGEGAVDLPQGGVLLHRPRAALHPRRTPGTRRPTQPSLGAPVVAWG